MVHIRSLHSTLILSYLTYCVMAWGNNYGTHLLPLFPKQKKTIIIVCNAKHKEHTSTLFCDMKLLTIYQVIKLRAGIFMHMAFHMKLSHNLQARFFGEN